MKKHSKERASIYTRIIKQYNFKYQTVFSARSDKQEEDNHLSNDTEICVSLSINKNLPETDFDSIDNRYPLQHQIQKEELKDLNEVLIKIIGWHYISIKLLKWKYHLR